MTTVDAGPDGLDYYLLHPGPVQPRRAEGQSPDRLEAIVVEEFVLDADHTAIRLDGTGWSPADRQWWGSSAFSRGLRVDPELRRRVVAVPRAEAAAAYRRLGGGELPDEATLRGYFGDGEPLATAAPLRLGPDPVGLGSPDRQVHRILFANELSPAGVANLGAGWRMSITGDLGDPRARVFGTAHRRIGDDAFSWELRRIGTGTAWCVDVTARLAGGGRDTLGPLLRELATAMRAQGLIPVTIERFS
ncbi:hypothetical protein AB0J86_06545 [Micromonospora sp. NPDC049559]|uniref:hypothetical protein n=1 Tax=Micromonospora sp. NPDC049559 TaxID=3155923 RepID=UPI00343F0065